MSSTLNADAYHRLIQEDIDWLLRQPRTLERDHVEQVLRFHLRVSPRHLEAVDAGVCTCGDTLGDIDPRCPVHFARPQEPSRE